VKTSLFKKFEKSRFSNVALLFFFFTRVFHFVLYEYQVDDTKLRRVVDRPGGCAPIQRDFSRLKTWANENLMKFIQGK